MALIKALFFVENCGVFIERVPYCFLGGVFVQPKQKLVAGLLGIFLGAWGIHQFYLGDNKKGIIRIVVTLVTCGIGGIWGFIEGILILCGNINMDAQGNPLV